ncbi:hypothetical protein GCM10010992_14210 [Cloacibacterium rupense]|uniref:Zinc-ribbon 15 domain-containing protein n=1 Tax=Cloacibacterium rupense TaxID=517423 RepID=A0ABQ2NJX7_9FLAO|nr:hypothetical protein [Cloacibacterium rupense]GGP03928.1 hypothetical protein GCM10010992_14210 [Cloacibacterium rupense]
MRIGIFKRDVLSKPLTNIECPHCKQNNTLRIDVAHHFFNLGLPIFPTGKTYTVTCNQCKKVFKPHQLYARITNITNRIVDNTKYSLWMYSFLIIMGILVPVILLKDYNRRKDNSSKINNPEIGDSYPIEVYKDSYSVYKVIKASKDSVYFVTSNFSTDYAGIDELQKTDESQYSDYIVVYSKEELEKMNSNDKIQEIVREKNH